MYIQVQEASNKAAAQYDKASSQYGAAKEMITVAEQQLGERLTSEDPSSPSPIDLAWQEMLNHATEKVSSFVRRDYQSVSETLASSPGSLGLVKFTINLPTSSQQPELKQTNCYDAGWSFCCVFVKSYLQLWSSF